MEEITLLQVLTAREDRVRRQEKMLAEFQTNLISFTMNIPGPVKNSPLIRRGFRHGLDALDRKLTGVLAKEITDAVTGCEALYAVDMDAAELKALCTAIEEATPMGRLFDIDVLDCQGHKLERQVQRCCMVCGAPGRSCAARRTHSVPELQSTTHSLLRAHFAGADAEAFVALAVESLLEEVRITPKPGLVDRRNSGSHRDMDITTFIASAKALGPYFRECVEIGMDTGSSAEEIFPRLRQAGIRAEEVMYRATGGVNTHKGAIFTLGILCGALGQLWKPEAPVPDMQVLLAKCAAIAQGAIGDFTGITVPATSGEEWYLRRGIQGIRGEAAAGLPSVARYGLPAFRSALAAGHSPNDAGVRALLQLTAQVEDTNLLRRGGPEGAAWAKAAARELLEDFSIQKTEALDDAFIARNLSPGGCADLLAVTLFLHKLTSGIL